MFMSRTVLFYAAPPVILGTLFTVYRMWFAGGAEDPGTGIEPPVVATSTGNPIEPFGGGHSPSSPQSTSPKPTTTAPAPHPATDAGAPVTDIESATRLVKELAAALYAAFPEVAQWARLSSVISDTVTAVDCVSNGGSPRRPLSFLAPKQPFQAKQVADGWVIDPASYARYDRVVTVFCAGDVAQVAAAYQRLEPALELAYRNLGYADGGFREVLGRAAGELLAVPVPTGPVYVVPGGPTYAFADPALQAQNDAHKHLLRAGPDNVRKVQARIRALAAAMKLGIIAP